MAPRRFSDTSSQEPFAFALSVEISVSSSAIFCKTESLTSIPEFSAQTLNFSETPAASVISAALTVSVGISLIVTRLPSTAPWALSSARILSSSSNTRSSFVQVISSQTFFPLKSPSAPIASTENSELLSIFMFWGWEKSIRFTSVFPSAISTMLNPALWVSPKSFG